MDDLETYLLDHFPFRDGLRKIKAYFAYDVLQQKENNDIYVTEGHAAKLEYPLNESETIRAAEKMKSVKAKYFPQAQVYYAVIPDKNFFLAQKNNFPSLDYAKGLMLRRLIWQRIKFRKSLIFMACTMDSQHSQW